MPIEPRWFFTIRESNDFWFSTKFDLFSSTWLVGAIGGLALQDSCGDLFSGEAERESGAHSRAGGALGRAPAQLAEVEVRVPKV